MKLFLIIYAGNAIGGVAGPLPYDMAECERRRDEFRTLQTVALETKFSKEQNRPLSADDLSKIKDMRFECEFRASRPALGSPA
ncbi:hypothetical protein GFL93_12745 [Rhizobium leguminosarum bv. viciae]|uniref:hypothetical protein n=1 Tax=Rhizobium TaxID=379 RepID=UPI0014414EF0|nr:hypothetical protein [Rhizobium leguminosarum]NKK06729.1 hypothetical protein [Rhizobium leguminosarum bv. viciae]